MVAADARTAVNFSLSPGNAGDAPEGRKLLKATTLSAKYMIMDRAYEGDETRQLVLDLGLGENNLLGVPSLILRKIAAQCLESCGVSVRCECFFLLISRKPGVFEIWKKPV
jgi:hypothetical protein